MSLACVSGQAALSARDTLRRIAGDDAYEKGLQMLPPEVAMEVRTMTNMGWVPTSTMRALYAAVAPILYRDEDELTDEVVHVSTLQNFRTVWKPFFRLISDEAILKRVPSLYKHARNRGMLDVQLRGPGRATITLKEWPDAHDRDIRTLAVAVRTSLEAMGRRDMVCTWKRRGAEAVFETSWRE